MPYYGDSLPYYYGGSFSNHSSLMTGAPRPFHSPLSRYSPHLSTISESPLSTLRRYSPATLPIRPRRVIDTADIDVSTPRIHHTTEDTKQQRNRLRRDRPTIKIRCQALKDNPALREHHERHEKSIGELLVEKFLIKDKKLNEDAEQRLQLFHQVSLDREEDDLQQVKNKITRRFTRRRSSADIQLDPEQLEREVAYAQVQAKVLDTLVAEEQAEIENEFRRGTLIKKGAVRGPRTVPDFFRTVDGEPVSQGEEEAAAQKMRKTMKKLKKKKKSSEKLSASEDGDSSRERRFSTSSDVSGDVQTSENDEEETRTPQMFKIEASNSVGDFATILVGGAVEQFRESVKIPVPRKIVTEKHDAEEESETEIVLPVKRPYVKDTSRNSVHFTVKTPPETLKIDPLEKLESITNGVKTEKIPSVEHEKESNENLKTPVKDKTISKPKKEGTLKQKTVEPSEKKVKESSRLKNEISSVTDSSETPLISDDKKLVDSSRSPLITAPKKETVMEDKKVVDSSRSLIPTPKKETITEDKKMVDSSKSPLITAPKKETIPEDKKMVDSSKSPLITASKKETLLDDKKIVDSSMSTMIPTPKKETIPEDKKMVDSSKSSLITAPKRETLLDDKKIIDSSVSPMIPAPKKEIAENKKIVDSSRSSLITAPKKETLLNDKKIVDSSVSSIIPVPKKEIPENKKIVDSSKSPLITAPKKEAFMEDKKVVDTSRSLIPTPKKETIPEDKKIVDSSRSPLITAPKKETFAEDKKVVDSSRSLISTPKKETIPEDKKVVDSSRFPRKETDDKKVEITAKRVEENNVTVIVDPLSAESSASVAEVRLPKASKINTDENNAVEAPKRSLREPSEYLAKVERDEDVVVPTLPGKKTDKAVTLKNAPASLPNSIESPKEIIKKDNLSSCPLGDVTPKQVTKTTEVLKSDTQKTEDAKKPEKNKLKDSKTSDEEASKSSINVATKKTDSTQIKVENKTMPKSNLQQKTEIKDLNIPWKNRFVKADSPAENNVASNKNISEDLKLKKTTESRTLKQSISVDDKLTKMPSEKAFALNGESGTLSKSTSSESIDFWNEIKGPESPQVTKTVNKGFGFAKSPGQPVEDLCVELDKKKETVAKISVAGTPMELSNIPVIEEESSKSDSIASSASPEKSEVEQIPKKGLKKKSNLSITIGQTSRDPQSTIKKTPLKREDSSASTVSTKSTTSTPDTSAFEISTPVLDVSVPLINVETPTPTPTNFQVPEEEEEEEPKTPTNEWPDGFPRISKWNNHNDLSNVDDAEKDITPVPSESVSAICSPGDTPESSKKKKVVRKKKSSTTKKSSTKKNSKKGSKESKKGSSKTQEVLKPPETKPAGKSSPKNEPTPRPIDLMKMFYITPSALLTATPRDLSKVRRAKIKRKKHHSRTPSVSSDSTGSTTSTATTESSGSTCTELDDDSEQKRINSTRSNDSGFDGSPRISTPSQSDTQRNSDSSDHFPSGRITPPATNLPRFKKYAVTDFNFLKVLGKGSFGKVLLAELRGTECVYAVKCLKKDVVLEDDDVECTLIERKVLTIATRHPYLCHLFCTFQTDSHLFFVMEYLNGGDLMFHIQKSGRFPETRARFYAAEIWSGLNFLHKKGIVYRDLKLDNVLLDFEGHIRIADFGMCKLQIFLDRTADTFCGTPDYMAPEIIKGLKYNQAVDWWSFGVLLYEMLTGQSPFSGCDEDELFWSICNERPFIPRYLSQNSTDILVALLEKDSGKRLPAHEIAMHSFFEQLPWDRLERRQLEPPFKPALDHTLDTKYFDTAFTAERPRLTPVPEQILTSMDQGVFRGFSYTNPNATD